MLPLWLLVAVSGRNAALDASRCCAGREKGRKPSHQLNTWRPAQLMQRQPARQSKKFNNYHTPFPSYLLSLLIFLMLHFPDRHGSRPSHRTTSEATTEVTKKLRAWWGGVGKMS
jgi:hypothetical protein